MDLQTKYVHIQNLWSNGPSKLSMYTYKTYGQMDLQTKYVHIQNLWSNGPSN